MDGQELDSGTATDAAFLNVNASMPFQWNWIWYDPRYLDSHSLVSAGMVPGLPGAERVICRAHAGEHYPDLSGRWPLGYSQAPYPGYPDDEGGCWIAYGGAQKKYTQTVYFLTVYNYDGSLWVA